MAELAITEGTAGHVFQLADPKPYPVYNILNMILEVLDRAPAVATVPDFLVEKLLEVPQISKLVGIQAESLTYFNHSVDFDVTNTLNFLKDTDVNCPDFRDYLPALISYAQSHPGIFKQAS